MFLWNLAGLLHSLCGCYGILSASENQSLHEILELEVSDYYKYEFEMLLLLKNIKPVVLEQIAKDGITKPPKYSGKRQAGRPKAKRLHKRSKFVDPDKSPIVCSRCRCRGHNKRSCTIDDATLKRWEEEEAREAAEEEAQDDDQDDSDEESSSSSSELEDKEPPERDLS